MRIYLDGQLVELGAGSVRTVGELVRYVNSQACAGETRVITSITVDSLDVHDWDEWSGLVLPDDAEIRVTTQTVAKLIASAIETAVEYTPRLEEGAIRVATLLQQGREEDAFVLIGQLVDGLHWYSEVLGSLSTLVPHEQRRASERLSALKAVTERLLEAWEARDYTLLADLLEYDLAAELRTDHEYVAELTKLNDEDMEHW